MELYPLYHGWTPARKRYCFRCGELMDNALYRLCDKCHEEDAHPIRVLSARPVLRVVPVPGLRLDSAAATAKEPPAIEP